MNSREHFRPFFSFTRNILDNIAKMISSSESGFGTEKWGESIGLCGYHFPSPVIRLFQPPVPQPFSCSWFFFAIDQDGALFHALRTTSFEYPVTTKVRSEINFSQRWACSNFMNLFRNPVKNGDAVFAFFSQILNLWSFQNVSFRRSHHFFFHFKNMPSSSGFHVKDRPTIRAIEVRLFSRTLM